MSADFIKLFFALLRSGLYGFPVAADMLPEKIDWNAIFSLARKHFVVGTIIDSVRFIPDGRGPKPTTLVKMEKFALGLIQTNLVLDRTAARLTEFLSVHNIRGVLLKGQGVARYYRQPQMRQSGDIDFFVGKKQYREACRLCRELLAENQEAHGETDQHFSFTLDGVTVELHRIASRIYTPTRNARFQQWIDKQLFHSPARRSLFVGETEVALPSVDFDAIFVFYHAWRHYITGGIGLRQLCDWAMIFHSHSEEIDKEQIIRNLNAFGMTEGWKLFACIAVHYLGVPAGKMPLYDPKYLPKSEKILEEIVEGGNFGYFLPDRHSGGRLYGIKYATRKLIYTSRYFLTLFPLIPVEASFLYLNRLYQGTRDVLHRSLKNL